MPESAYLLHHFKFQQRFVDGRVLAEILAQKLMLEYHDQTWPDLIVPVPLHYRRLISRGFNQASLLAKNLKLPLSINYRLVKRIRHNPRQVGLSGKLRRRNLRGAFKLTKSVQGLHIALVDDVITTGSTLQAIALELKKAGAKQVDVWCALRAQVHR
jgi:ComF family protein